MLKKIGIIALVFLVLVGCSEVKTIDVESVVNEALSKPMPTGTNYNKNYFRYYLPLNANLRKSTQISSLVLFDESLILMQLNVSKIVTKQYYTENEEEVPLLQVPQEYGYTEFRGIYQDREGINKSFVLAYKLVGNDYVMVLSDEYVEMTSVIPSSKAELTLDTMITIMRSIEVDEALVVATFSNKEIINYVPIREEFFEVAIPETGSLIDMYNRLNPDEPIETNNEGD